MRQEVVLREVVRFLLPYILLFALYVQFHGDFGPGGGFQAGVMFGAGLILFAMVYGAAQFRRLVPQAVVRTLAGAGVLLYGGTGVVTMLLGGNYLEYAVLDPHDPVHGQHYGIMAIELGVGITVASVMLLIFTSFAGRDSE